MLTYNMAEHGELPLYEYLYRRIRDDIAGGAIAPEDRLPSKRALAQALGVSLITVESAYAQLIAEGYVIARPRRGYYAAPLPQPGPSRRARATAPAPGGAAFAAPSGRPRHPLPTASPEGDAHPAAIADFSSPARPGASPGAALWTRALRDALAHEPESELFGPRPPQGAIRLRRAIAADLLGSRGMAVDPRRIVVGAGAQVLYVLVAQLLGRGRPFAVEDPGYPRLAQTYAACGVPVRFARMDRNGIDIGALRASGAGVVHVMPSHQFPTGRVTSIARRYELLGWAAQEPGRYIVEDDYDREFRLAGRPIPPLQSIDAEGRVIYVSTFSKSLSQALRMAYLVLPEGLVAPFEERLGFYASTLSSIDQIALARLLESGAYERHVNRYRKQQRDLRDALLEAIRASAFGGVAQVEEADSGLHFVLAVETPHPEAEIARRAAAEGVVLAPLSGYLHDPANAPRPDGRARFVMQYGGLDPGVLPRVAGVLERALA